MREHPVYRYKQLRPQQLRTFCECVRRKSFTEAARALKVSLPAVWQQVRALERGCGASLLQRRDGHWEPTEDGQLVLELAANIVGALDSFYETFERRQYDLPRSLVIVAPPNILTEDLSECVVEFGRAQPRVLVTLRNYVFKPIEDMVVAGDADMAILALYPEEPVNRLLVLEPLGERRAALALPREHPLAKRRRIMLPDIVRYPLILTPPDTPWRRRVDDTFRRAGLLEQRKVLLECGQTLASRRYVDRGFGIALFPLPERHVDLPHTCIRRVDHLFETEPVVVLRRRGMAPSPAAQVFVDLARKQFSAAGVKRPVPVDEHA